MYPPEITELAQEYGFKAANLIYLQKLFAKLDQNIIIPSFLTISKNDIIKHLNKNAPNWVVLWEQFITSHHSTNIINADSEEILNELQSTITKAFNAEVFHINFDSKSSYLMIRSSGTEDSEIVANPGGNASYPSFNDPQNISCAIGKVVASYFSAKSMGQRLKSGENIDDKLPTLACLLQDFFGEYSTDQESIGRCIIPPVSGVIYTDFGNIHIQAAHGHGELVVNSLGFSDDYYVSRENIVYTVVREKKFRLAAEFNKNTNSLEFRRKENHIALAITASIPEKIAIKIANSARIIENDYGMRMDIEFVYHPNQRRIAIVQARPIVEFLPLVNSPNSVSKDYILQHPDMIRCKGEMLTLSVMNICIIENPDEILVFDTINQALAKWIQHRDTIKGIVVRDYAPSTSHEVGMFNSKGIPVIQVNDINDIQKLIAALGGGIALVFDPQNSSIFQIAAHEIEKAEQNSLIQDGLFQSVLSHHVTPPKKIAPPIGAPAVLIQNLLSFLNDQAPQVRKKYNSLHEIKTDLNQLSMISTKEEMNNKLKTNLGNLMIFAYDSRLRKDGSISAELFAKIVETGALLFDKINKMKLINDVEKDRIYRIEYLNILKKFEGLFVAIKKSGFLSSSIFSELSKERCQRLRLKPLELKTEQLAYYHEFMKLRNYIAIKDKNCEWDSFCNDICKLGLGSKLAEIVAYLVRQDIHEFWINYHFYKIKENISNKTPKDLLDFFFAEIETCGQNKDLTNVSQKIEQMENQIDLWSMPDNFEKFIQDFSSEILIISDTLFRKQENFLSYISNFKLIDKFVDVFDRSIKSLQHGKYNGQQKAMQVERFRILLSVFFEILEKSLGSDIINDLKSDFQSLQDNHENQLDITPTFNVTQANPLSYKSGPSDTSIQRSLSEPHTLADIHSVIHQALISHNAKKLISHAKDIYDYLPLKMQNVIKNMQQLPIFAKDLSRLVLCNFQLPEITTKFNIPLNNHAAQIFIIYNVDEECFRIKMEGYGGYCKYMWSDVAANILKGSSETNAVIKYFEIYSQGCIFDAIIKTPEECYRIFQAFSDYLPYFMTGHKNKICSEMPINFQPLSNGIMNIFIDVKTFDKVKEIYLTHNERDLISNEISRYNIPEDKKNILLTYNGMALIKAGEIDEIQAQELELDRLQIMCSDNLMSVYFYPDAFLGLQSFCDDKTVEILTSYKARKCYQAGASFTELCELFEKNKEKFNMMTCRSAVWAYASGAIFAELLLLDDKSLEGLFNKLKNPSDYGSSFVKNQEFINHTIKDVKNKPISNSL
jgi:hypothetical protein